MNTETNQNQTKLALISSIENLISNIYFVVVKLFEPILVQAGQYILLKNCERKLCAYSIFEQIDEYTLKLLIKAVPNRTNINNLETLSHEKTCIEFRGPYGLCTLDPRITHTICIAHGMGIAPVNSMLNCYKNNFLNQLSIFWFADQEKLQPLITLIKDQVSKKSNIRCFIMNSFSEQFEVIFEAKMSEILIKADQTECLLFGSYKFVNSCIEVLSKFQVGSIKSDYKLSNSAITAI